MKRLVLAVVVVCCVVPLSGVVTAEEGANGPVCLKVLSVSDKLVSDSPGYAGRKTVPSFDCERQLDQRTPFSETALDDQGQPVSGAHDLVLSYFEPEGAEPIWVERLPNVDFIDGRFDVFLGAGMALGKSSYTSLQSVFAAHPDLEMEVGIDGVTQTPRVGILPAGHSPETRAMLLGPVSKDELHTKGYRAKSETTSVQAVTLRPSDGKSIGTVDDTPTLKTSPFLIDTIYLGTSGPVRDMPAAGTDSRVSERPVPREVNPPRHENLYDDDGYLFGTRTVKIDDPLVKESQRGGDRATPSLLVGFEGIPFTNVTPPDPEGAVGLNHYVQVVNSQFRIYDKTGTPVTTAVNTNSLWSGFGGLCETDNYGDAIFLYDEPADRWVLTQFTSGNVVCFAVSTTDDPTWTYELYQVNTQKFPDYYKLGVWPDPDNNAYFMGTNTGYQGDYDIYAIDRENMLTGSAARSAQYFQDHPNLLMPADLDGDNMPPAGQPGIFYTFRDGGESYFIPLSPVDTLDIWEFDVDWNAPANTTFGLVQQITPAEGLADFNWTVCGFFTSDCLPQPGTSFLIDSASWWPMQRLQYRNFGNYEALVGSWTVDTLSSGDHAAPRWFELRRMTPTPSASWSMAYQGTLSPDDVHRWMPSVALDGSGNMGIAYSAVDAVSVYPSLRYATRDVDSPTFDTEAEMVTGLSYYTDTNYYRWGDYSSIEVDPADDCTFWYTGEWIKSGTSWNWTTYVGAFKVPGCTGSTCDAEAPTGLSAAANGDNEIYVSWNAAVDATEYWIYRSQTSGGPYTQVGTVFDPTTNFADTTVSANVPYYYVVRTYTTCVSPYSLEVSATTTGICTEPPSFSGITSATNGSVDDPCTIGLEWDPATLYCGGPLTYQIYRDTSSGFVPGGANQIATGVTCSGSPCTYTDTDALTSGQPYYYVVRAFDASLAVEETNTVEATATPTGSTPVFQQLFFDDYDGNRPANADDYYILGSFNGGAVEWHQPETYRSYSTTNSYNFGPGGGDSYARNQDAGLVIGGDGTGPSGANGFVITQAGFELSFWHTYNMVATGDGVALMFSTTGPLSGYLFVPDTVTAGVPYISDGGYTSTISALAAESWGGNATASWSQVVVNLDGVAGQTVWFLWRAYTDNGGSTVAEGYYLDDVNLDGYVPGPCTTGGGCTDPGAVTIDSITDDDACAQDGVTITFSGGSGASSFDLYDDGGLAVSGFTSGSTYDPGDTLSHSYIVRALDQTCFTESSLVNATDENNTVAAPGAPSVSDLDACALTGVQVGWTGVAGATSYDLLVDGVTTVVGVTNPYTHNPGDADPHDYQVRGVNATCGGGAWSGATSGTDLNGISTVGAPTVTDISQCALDGVSIGWLPVAGATAYDLLVDGTTTVVGVTNPYVFAPGDSLPHDYQIRGRSASCNGGYSASTAGTDLNFAFTYSGIDTATDRDSCDDTGVVVTWSAPTSWNDGGAGSRTFTVYRGVVDVSGALAEGTTSFVDTTGVNGTSYDYSVVGSNGYGCTAGGATTIAATDVVGGAPTFGGVQSVNTMPGGVCGLSVEWNAATSNCGPTIVYNVYRSTTSGFSPDPATNMIAGCVADLFFEDTAVSGLTNYYYVVRAEDSSAGHGGPCNDGFEDTNIAEVGGILIGGNETGSQVTDPLQVTSGSALSIFAPDFTFPTAAAASLSYTLNYGGGAGGTLSYDYAPVPATINAGATTTFTQTVTESETITSVDLNISLTPPNPVSSNLLVELVHVNSLTSVTVYNGAGNGFVNGSFGPYTNFNALDSASDWQLVVTATGDSRAGSLASWNLSIDYSGSGDVDGCTQVELIDPSATPTVLKAYGVADANPYDVTGFYTGGGTYQILLSENCGSQGEITGATMSVDEPACVAASADPVQYFTARSTGSNVKLEWQNPVSGYASTRICWDGAAFPVDPANCTNVLVDQIGIAGAYDTTTHSGLTNGSNYYFAAFVDNGSGEYSSRQTVAARPFDTAGQTKWAYHTSATALAPPGLYPGAAGTGASYGVSNDRVLHGMNSTTGGGDWPRTAPFDWIPMGMNGPAQSRPPIVPTTVGAADLVAFLGSQDGHVYAVNAKTGATLWQSAQNYGLVQGAPAGMFTAFGGAYDVLFAGSRVAGSGNSMFGLNPSTGINLWEYGGTIGIISSGATVDYATNRIYFASRENPSGSDQTLWCIQFTDSGASLLWSQAYGDIDSAPVLFDGVLYIGTNAGIVAAVNPVNGDKIWTFSTNDGPVKGYVDFEFVTGGPRKVFFATTTSVWALTDNGVSVSFEWQQSGVGGPSIPLTLADQGAMYVGSTDGRLYQLNPTSGGIVTSVVMGAGTATVGSPGYDWMNSLAYVGAEDGSVYAVTLPLQ